MRPRWATVAGYGLYFYAAERHRRPHVDARQGDERATGRRHHGRGAHWPALSSGLRSVQSLLAEHREAAVFAFTETLEHRFPGTLGSGTRRLRITDLGPPIDVTDVRVLARYVVELTFADASERVIDLEPLLWGPMFEPLVADYGLFRRVRVDPEAGTVVWPNGADISPRTLFAESRPTVPA